MALRKRFETVISSVLSHYPFTTRTMSASYDATAQTKVADPSTTQTTISPITGQAVVTRPLATSTSDLDSAVEASHAAYLSWRKVPLKERMTLVEKGIKHLAGRSSELASELTEQMGRPIRYGNAEFSTFDDRGMWLLGQAEKSLGDEEVGPDRPEGFRRIIRRAPVGVCLLVGAWNVSARIWSSQSHEDAPN